LIVLGAVGFVLLIACANVASMVSVPPQARRLRFGPLLALDARLIRQILTETVILALVGGGIGLLLAVWGIDLLKSLQPENLPRIQKSLWTARCWSSHLLFPFLGLLFGLFPALQFPKRMLNDSLKEGSGRVAGGLMQRRMRYGLWFQNSLSRCSSLEPDS
jgi:ABC-type antimicrobial peptide transport system permease subunit